MKILDFFLFFWVNFALLDPEPDPQFECGSGSSNLNYCGSGSCVKISFCMDYFSMLNTCMRKWKDPDPYLWLMKPDPGNPKTPGSGSPTLLFTQVKIQVFYLFWRTLGRKLGGGGPGGKLTSVVQAANTRKIGKKISISLVKVCFVHQISLNRFYICLKLRGSVRYLYMSYAVLYGKCLLQCQM